MPNSDWEKELARIDRQLASLSDEALEHAATSSASDGVERSPRPAPAGGTATAAAPVPAPGPAAPSVAPKQPRRWVLYVRLAIALALAVGIIFWPYGTRCGAPLAGYLAGVGAIVVGGAWTALWSWRHRAGMTHVLSLLILLWGLGLASWQVLPRVGLAIPTIDRPALWTCN